MNETSRRCWSRTISTRSTSSTACTRSATVTWPTGWTRSWLQRPRDQPLQPVGRGRPAGHARASVPGEVALPRSPGAAGRQRHRGRRRPGPRRARRKCQPHGLSRRTRPSARRRRPAPAGRALAGGIRRTPRECQRAPARRARGGTGAAREHRGGGTARPRLGAADRRDRRGREAWRLWHTQPRACLRIPLRRRTAAAGQRRRCDRRRTGGARDCPRPRQRPHDQGRRRAEKLTLRGAGVEPHRRHAAGERSSADRDARSCHAGSGRAQARR